VLETALNDAVDAGREQFGTADILLAIVSDSRGVGGEVLRSLGVTADRLRAQRDR
jgi:ATP-dependent Clp protease ATP-binding subunit ClpA